MGAPAKGKHLKKESKRRMTPEQLKERARKLNAARTKRWRDKKTAEERSALYARDTARCVDREALEALVDKQEGTGCWLWTGPWNRVFQVVRPEMRAGKRGHMDAAKAMYLATHGGTIPARWSVGRRCGRVECVSPDHLTLESPALRSAKRRRQHHGEEAGLRVRTGGDEPGDDRRCG